MFPIIKKQGFINENKMFFSALLIKKVCHPAGPLEKVQRHEVKKMLRIFPWCAFLATFNFCKNCSLPVKMKTQPLQKR